MHWMKGDKTMLTDLYKQAEGYYWAIFKDNDNFSRNDWESSLGEVYEECILAGHSKTILDKIVHLAYMMV